MNGQPDMYAQGNLFHYSGKKPISLQKLTHPSFLDLDLVFLRGADRCNVSDLTISGIICLRVCR